MSRRTTGKLNISIAVSTLTRGLQARVLPAGSEMLTTMTVQIVRFARPSIQIYDVHVVDLYQWVRAR
jgi:hypothetical protein